MNREDIENRIIVCEERAKGYREVGKNFVADKYDNEKYKWEKLLSDLDLLNERKVFELLEYKKGYFNFQQENNQLKEIIEEEYKYLKQERENHFNNVKLCTTNLENLILSSALCTCDHALEILSKVKGEENENS